MAGPKLDQEESRKGHREESSCDVMRVRMVINAPQRGHCQVEAVCDGPMEALQKQRSEGLAAQRKGICSETVGQKSEVADTHETMGQYIQEETPNSRLRLPGVGVYCPEFSREFSRVLPSRVLSFRNSLVPSTSLLQDSLPARFHS